MGCVGCGCGCVCVCLNLKLKLTWWFLSAHIPYAQSEGILPKYELLQWVEYISKSTQWISTKLCRDMVEALSFQKTLKYWWPLTYIQGHVIQDGRQIHFSKSNLGPKLPITQPFCFLVKFNNFCFVLSLEISSPLWMEKQYQQWFHVSFGSRVKRPSYTTLHYYGKLHCWLEVAIFNWEWWENWSKLSQCHPWYLCNDI